jgi:hypothetical protein
MSKKRESACTPGTNCPLNEAKSSKSGQISPFSTPRPVRAQCAEEVKKRPAGRANAPAHIIAQNARVQRVNRVCVGKRKMPNVFLLSLFYFSVGLSKFCVIQSNTWKRVRGCLCERGNTNSEIVGNPNFGFQFPNPFHRPTIGTWEPEALPTVATGRLLSNFLNFIFHGPPGLSTVDFMFVLE